MRVVIQRVRASQVVVDGQVVGKIGVGLNILVGITAQDTIAELDWIARKCLDLRLFPAADHEADHENDKGSSFERSIREIGGELLVISQFTLYGDCRKGRRPSFSAAAAPDRAKELYLQFVAKLRESGLKVETGIFGAMMQVAIENDGPVTLILERSVSDR
ncbi:D-tyrosyl-tRNA(Tyr) deacylase [Thalassoporum mexicanum PCC 7367]|uniref:D-aminoacyl-tRNA deacylase n=1 Tax=Thalassoporum mexicanum TaxID=3457544 RepID=UPI00029FF036|nr:D-aminoacyl-tRNA deacylase [Pseudanabaena sp. PCC 7367]AFY68631.1 D-tyrosyl-tRNA(Tyr) deacylase [Pseudanabaena sp. PCC 7367]